MTTRSRARAARLVACALLVGVCGSAASAAQPAIAFKSARDGGNWEIYVMDPDGGNQRNISHHPGDERTPDWSPDGQSIVFVSTRGDAAQEIYVMDADGGNQRNISNELPTSLDPAWSPDGSVIAYAAYRGRNQEIALIDSDGANPRNLTNHAGPATPALHGRPMAGASPSTHRATTTLRSM